MGLLVAGDNSPGFKTVDRSYFTATAGQTIFTVTQGYQVGDIDVYLNGIRLLDLEDYTATNGSTIVLTSGANLGDSLTVIAYTQFNVSGAYTKNETDNRYLNLNGGTLSGYLKSPNYGVTSGNDTTAASLEASPSLGEQGAGVKVFGRSMATNGGDVLYTADSRGAGGRHRFGYWNGTSFNNTMTLDSSGRLLVPNQPVFSARYVGGSTPLTGIISFNTTQVSNPAWNGSRFTAQVAGNYFFSFTGFMESSTSANGDIELRKNGTQYARTYSSEAASVYRPFAVSAVMRLEVGEYCESYSLIQLHPNANPNICGFLIG